MRRPLAFFDDVDPDSRPSVGGDCDNSVGDGDGDSDADGSGDGDADGDSDCDDDGDSDGADAEKRDPRGRVDARAPAATHDGNYLS